MENTKLRRLLFVLFFLSGLAALVYEVVWARKLSLIFGTTTFAISSILAVFFAGLALGSWIFGKIADKRGLGRISADGVNPLLLYGLLEVGIGAYAAGTPWIFRLIEGLQASFWQRFSPTYSGFSIFTFGLSFLGLIIPTILMGGTLPVLAKFWVKREEDVGGGVGALYFINTAGAVLGAFLAGFLLIASLGVNESIWLAALINLVVGGIVLFYANKLRMEIVRMDANIRVDSQGLNSRSISVLIAFGLAGFAALALEVLWTRVLVMVIGGSVYAFTIVLVAFLVGIALGSAIMSRFTDRLQNSLIWFAGIEILLGISVILLTPLLGDLPFWFLGIYQSFGDSFSSLQFGLWLMTVGAMIIPTLLMGMAFPVVVKAYSRMEANERIGGDVGKVYAANTVGGIFGSLAAGFIFIPLLGVQKGIWLAAAIYLLVGTGIIFLTKIPKLAKVLISCFIFLIILIGLRLPSWNKSVLTAGFYKEPFVYLDKEKKEIQKAVKAHKILYYKEDIGAIIVVTQNIYEDILSLRINGKVDASTGADMENQLLAGHIPMLFHPDPESVLVVGMGSGITLGAVEQYPAKSIEAIEIEPAVVEAAKYFADYSHDALADPRLKMIVADGRNYLLTTEKSYDVITSEPSNPWLAGPSKLFTQEYFELVKSCLAENGVMLQWINLYAFAQDDLRTLIATFKSVFPNSLAFNVLTSNDLLLVGGKNKLVLDLEQIGSKMRQEKVKADLARVGIEEPLELLSYLTMDGEAMEEFAKETPLNTDNHPVLEFSAPKSLYLPTQAGNLREMMKFWVDPLIPISADEELMSADRARIKELVAFREHFAKMMIAYTEDNLGEGAKEGEEAFKIEPNHPGVLEYLSQIYLYQGTFALERQDYQVAEAAFLQALAIRETTEGHFRLGLLYLNQGNPSEAEREFSMAVARSPEFAAGHFNLGLALEGTGDLNRAIEEFEKTLELEPDFSQAHEELVKLYEMRGNYGKAEEHREAVE